MTPTRGGRMGRDERGVAMITAMILLSVMVALTAIVFTMSEHDSTVSARGRSWVQALHVAEAGANQAIARANANPQLLLGAPAGAGQCAASATPITGTTSEGTYQYKITRLPRGVYQIESIGAVGSAPSLSATRRVCVTLAPPPSFQYALLSLGNIDTKNTNNLVGDIWANGSITIYNGDTVTGNATAATGSVFLGTNSTVTGNVWSGGYNTTNQNRAVDLSSGSSIGGTVTASSTTPGCTDDPGHVGYTVNVTGTITGTVTVTTWGTITGSGPTGFRNILTCTAAPAPKSIPPFAYNPANYPVPPLTFSSPDAFTTYLNGGSRTSLAGTFYIQGGGATQPIDLTGVQIAGDTTIIATDAPINADGVGAVNNNDKVLVLASYYSQPQASLCTTNSGNPGDCAIGFKNNFQPANNTATLLYAPNGPISFKNNANFSGAVYANNIQLKNGTTLTYDPRIQQVVGFGTTTLQPANWVELTP